MEKVKLKRNQLSPLCACVPSACGRAVRCQVLELRRTGERESCVKPNAEPDRTRTDFTFKIRRPGPGSCASNRLKTVKWRVKKGELQILIGIRAGYRSPSLEDLARLRLALSHSIVFHKEKEMTELINYQSSQLNLPLINPLKALCSLDKQLFTATQLHFH